MDHISMVSSGTGEIWDAGRWAARVNRVRGRPWRTDALLRSSASGTPRLLDRAEQGGDVHIERPDIVGNNAHSDYREVVIAVIDPYMVPDPFLERDGGVVCFDRAGGRAAHTIYVCRAIVGPPFRVDHHFSGFVLCIVPQS